MCDLFCDPSFLPSHQVFGFVLVVEATQALLHRLGFCPDLQGVLGDFSRNAWHVRWFPRKDISVGAEEVDERVFLFGEKCGAGVHRFALGATGVYEDHLDALRGLKGSGRPLGVGCLLGSPFLDDCELLGGDDCQGMLAALNLALVGALEGGADGDDPAWARHL